MQVPCFFAIASGLFVLKKCLIRIYTPFLERNRHIWFPLCFYVHIFIIWMLWTEKTLLRRLKWIIGDKDMIKYETICYCTNVFKHAPLFTEKHRRYNVFILAVVNYNRIAPNNMYCGISNVVEGYRKKYSRISICRSWWDYFYKFKLPEVQIKKVPNAKLWLRKQPKYIFDSDRRFEIRRIRYIRVRDIESRL